MEYGNLAYKLPERYEEPIHRRKPQTNRVRVVKRNHEQMLIRNKIMRRICVVVVIAMSAGFMISEFVTVNETQQQVASLRKELDEIESVTSQMVFDMEQSVDLAEVEKQATARLGMQRPEKYQTVYVNVRQDDYTESTAGEVEGIGNGIVSLFKNISGNIVQFFSIK